MIPARVRCEEIVDLRKREQRVLGAIIALYLQTGRAVASRQVSRRPGQELSPASIRNLMSGLEEKGFLFREHSSAGCIPTDAGLRFFIDSVRHRLRITPGMRREVEARCAEYEREHVDDPVWMARLAAELTSEAGIVVRPMDVSPVLESLTLLPLGGRRVLGVVVTSNGLVQKRAVSMPEGGVDPDLHSLATRATEILRGRHLDEIPENLPEQRRLFGPVEYLLLMELFSGDEGGEVQVTGTENLVADEAFSELERIRSAVRLLEDRSGIAAEWRRALQDRQTRVFIGEESRLTSDGRLGMVATVFFRGPRPAGAVGVVGPRRMNYLRVLPMIECIGQTLSRRLAGDE